MFRLVFRLCDKSREGGGTPELDTSPEPNRLITALHPTIPVFEVMHIKRDSNRMEITVYGRRNRCGICNYAVSEADVVANTNPWKIE